MRKARPYHHLRFNWWRDVDLKEIEEELGESFTVEDITIPWDDREISLFKDMNEELKVKADTLTAFLSPIRVVLFQREAAPFTARDMELRKRIQELYPRDRPTPFPFMFGKEPEFEVAEEDEINV